MFFQCDRSFRKTTINPLDMISTMTSLGITCVSFLEITINSRMEFARIENQCYAM